MISFGVIPLENPSGMKANLGFVGRDPKSKSLVVVATVGVLIPPPPCGGHSCRWNLEIGINITLLVSFEAGLAVINLAITQFLV